ncbi:MAG: ComEC/Rec2 family competence protein [Roseiflexaceae bacterium]
MTKTSTDSPAGRRRKLASQITLLLTTLLLLAWRAQPDGHLHVIFLETKGDAALIQTPAGGYVLIDGGGDPAALTAALGRRMPFWRRTLDMVVLTSPDSQHLPGQVAALARYRAGAALAPPVAKRSATLNEWRRLLDEQGSRFQVARAGDRLDLGGATLRVLAAGDGDESGLLLRLDYGATNVVFDHSGGEADEEALAAIGPPRATLLAFPWQRDPRAGIVESLRPRALVFTDGQEADRPAELTLTTRAIGGAAVYHERLNGAIEWISDGRRSWIVTER